MLEKITGQKTFKDAFKKVAWFRFTIIITIAVFLIIGVIEAINNPVKPTKPVNSTPTTKAQSTTTSPKIEKNKSYITSSGIQFRIHKITDLANQKYYNIHASISKNNPLWHDQAKEIIKFLSEQTGQKDFSVAIVEQSTGTDLLNWNTGKNKTIYYTFPVDRNESEVFEL